MMKFKAPFNSIEILSYNKYKAGFINRQIILLLSTLGIKDEVFLDMQKEFLKIFNQQANLDASIFSYLNNEDLDPLDSVRLKPMSTVIQQMINAKVNPQSDPVILFLQEIYRARGYHILRKRSNFEVKKSARLIGVTDELGILKEKEIYCNTRANVCSFMNRPSNQQSIQTLNVTGDVIITRNPCLHFGDIRKVRAVSDDELAKRNEEKNGKVGQGNPLKHFINTVVFSQKGSIPTTCEISGSDLDGDLFFISWDQRLIPKQMEQAFNYDAEKGKMQESKEESKMLDFFTYFMTSDCLGQIDNAHLVQADQHVNDGLAKFEKCIQLSELHATAVDFAKKRIYALFQQEALFEEVPRFFGEGPR
eukprot:TRINITY_DN10029_c0_g1_i2.p1 TRINITY_DN10029_c0_g1~~TRINITY_DN10029_c0_g1_i2.p1  ORF type:complete len:363 (-),score=43.10 TRINITY_DN10029_c0_g1_i2:312-1400(-)